MSCGDSGSPNAVNSKVIEGRKRRSIDTQLGAYTIAYITQIRALTGIPVILQICCSSDFLSPIFSPSLEKNSTDVGVISS